MRARDGELLTRLGGESSANARPALHDVDDDGALELLTGGRRGLAAWRIGEAGEWAEVWRAATARDRDGAPVGVASPLVLHDFHADGRAELVVGYLDGSLRVHDVTSGDVLWQFHGSGRIEAPPVVVDVDGDGAEEILLAGTDRTLTCIRSDPRPR